MNVKMENRNENIISKQTPYGKCVGNNEVNCELIPYAKCTSIALREIEIYHWVQLSTKGMNYLTG